MQLLAVVDNPDQFAYDVENTCVFDVMQHLRTELPSWATRYYCDVNKINDPHNIRSVVHYVLDMLDDIENVIITGLPESAVWAEVFRCLGATFITDTKPKKKEGFLFNGVTVPGMHLESGSSFGAIE